MVETLLKLQILNKVSNNLVWFRVLVLSCYRKATQDCLENYFIFHQILIEKVNKFRNKLVVLFKGKEFLSNRDEQLFGFDFLTELVHQINEAVMQKNGVLLQETDQRMDGLLEILRKRQ